MDDEKVNQVKEALEYYFDRADLIYNYFTLFIKSVKTGDVPFFLYRADAALDMLYELKEEIRKDLNIIIPQISGD